MKFSDKIKYVRCVLGVSQADLARSMGVSFATVNRWENGLRQPSTLGNKAFADFCEKKSIIFNCDGNDVTDIYIGGRCNG